MTALEDEVTDILAKAQRGLGLGDRELCKLAAVDFATLGRIRDGSGERAATLRVARALRLDGGRLLGIERGDFKPEAADLAGLKRCQTPHGAYQVNNYVIFDEAAKEALVFDAGSDPRPTQNFVGESGLSIAAIFLTHRHSDHVGGLSGIRSIAPEAPIYGPHREPIPGANPLQGDETIHAGAFEVQTLPTPGHTAGHISFALKGLGRPVVLAGDAIFAGSIGGPNHSLEEARQSILDRFFTLPDNTLLCPGHGPITTVGEEKAHNPFFGPVLAAEGS